MKPRWKSGLLVGPLAFVVFGLVCWYGWRQETPSKWLLVSEPHFAKTSNAADVPHRISFTISNAASCDMDISVAWFECRRTSDFSLVSTKPPHPPGGGGISRPLYRNGSTNIILELPGSTVFDGEPLFCCEVTWVERESRLRRWGRKVNEPMYWLAAFFEFNWEPPWRNQNFANGAVFVSNLEVADYFDRVHGLQRESWLKQQRLKELSEQRAREELARLNAGSTRGRRSILRFNQDRASPAADATREAEAAFADFCLTSNNAVVHSRRGRNN